MNDIMMTVSGINNTQLRVNDIHLAKPVVVWFFPIEIVKPNSKLILL